MRASSSNSPREKRRRRHQTTSQGPFGEDRSEALGITGRFHRRGRSQQRRRHVLSTTTPATTLMQASPNMLPVLVLELCAASGIVTCSSLRRCHEYRLIGGLLEEAKSSKYVISECTLDWWPLSRPYEILHRGHSNIEVKRAPDGRPRSLAARSPASR